MIRSNLGNARILIIFPSRHVYSLFREGKNIEFLLEKNILVSFAEKVESYYPFREYQIVKFPKLTSKNEKILATLNTERTFFYLFRSKSFAYRLGILEKINKLSYLLKILFFFKIKIISGIKIFFLKLKLNILKSDIDFFRNLNLDLIILVNTSFEPSILYTSIIAKKLNIKTFVLPLNWDNVSSKSVLVPKPNYVGAFSEQVKEHINTIQKISLKNIFLIGTPRFDKYFEISKLSNTYSFDFDYILFVGVFKNINEKLILDKLEQIINTSPIENLKIVYRPYPKKKNLKLINDFDYKNIILDPNFQTQRNTIHKNFYNQEFLVDLIRNSKFVIGGLTSMILEVSLLKKNFLALSYDDKSKSFISPQSIYFGYEHFKGLEKINTITFCSDLNLFENLFYDILRKSNGEKLVELPENINYFYPIDERTSAQRLQSAIESILDTDSGK